LSAAPGDDQYKKPRTLRGFLLRCGAYFVGDEREYFRAKRV
jgi:hypothetical protein